MRVVVQRVSRASCSVDDHVVSAIGRGYLLLVGFQTTDTADIVRHVARKIARLRVFEDAAGKLNHDIAAMHGEILSISQFTLYGDTSKGNRPSFTKAMRPDQANELYELFNRLLNDEHGIPTKGGVFQEHMMIDLINDGPVTVIVEKDQ